MTIVGHGIDIVEVAAFAELFELPGARPAEVYFTQAELRDAGTGPNRIQRLAARFAAKEAVLKALGTGWSQDIAWTDIEVVTLPSGQPTLRLAGGAIVASAQRQIGGWEISMSHVNSAAIASVIAIKLSEAVETSN
jgi:holo-[acyl-carrier protein] synthase